MRQTKTFSLRSSSLAEAIDIGFQELADAVKTLAVHVQNLKPGLDPMFQVFALMQESLACTYVLLQLLCIVGCCREDLDHRQALLKCLKNTTVYCRCYQFLCDDPELICLWEDLINHSDYDSDKGCDSFAIKNHLLFDKITEYLKSKVYNLTANQGLAELIYECLGILYLIGYVQIFIISLKHDRKALHEVIVYILKLSLYHKFYELVCHQKDVSSKWQAVFSKVTEWNSEGACVSFAKDCHHLFYDFIDASCRPPELKSAPGYLDLLSQVFISAYAVFNFTVIATVHNQNEALLNKECGWFKDTRIYPQANDFMQKHQDGLTHWKTVAEPKGIATLTKCIEYLDLSHGVYMDCVGYLTTDY